MSGRNPPLYLIAIQGHTKDKNKRHDEPLLQFNLLHWMGVDERNLQVMDVEMINGKLSNNYSYGTYLQVL